MAKQASTAPRFRILHNAVGNFTQGQVVQFSDDIDTDRLVRLGAVETTTDDLTPTDDIQLLPTMSTGSDTAAFEAGAARAAGVQPTGPAANPDNVQAAKDQATGKQP